MPYVPIVLTLSFFSRAAFRHEPTELAALVRDSSAKNRRLRVTGALLYDGAHFLEVIEGDPATIRTLAAVIFRDRRHTDIEGTLQEIAPRRRFGRWSMKRLGAGGAAAALDRAALATMAPAERVALAERLLAV